MKILLVAFNAPPQALTSATRPTWLAQQLAERGHAVTLLTLDPEVTLNDHSDNRRDVLTQSGVRIINLKPPLRSLDSGYYKDTNTPIARITRAASRILGISSHLGWKISLERFARSVSVGDWDIVVGTARPFETIEGACMIADRSKSKLAVDYRDPCWVGAFPDFHQGTVTQRKREMFVLKRADLVTVISWSMKERLAQQTAMHEKIVVVTNGFEPVEFENIDPLHLSTPSLIYGGTIYPEFRTLDPLYKAYSVARSRCNSTPPLHVYVRDESKQLAEVSKYDLTDIVHVNPYVTRRKSLQLLKGSLGCVVVASSRVPVTPSDRWIVTSKVFEAIAMNVPVLLIGPRDGDAARVVEAYGNGVIFEPTEVEEMARWLTNPTFSTASSNSSAFEWKKLGSYYADLLEAL